MIRTFDQSEVEILAECSSIPIINGLTDDEHPCQVLADLMTIRENKKILEGLTVAYIGDGNNMAQSLLVGCLTCGMNFNMATPEGYRPKNEYLELGEKLSKENDVNFIITDSP
ncbi:MAG: ornithine carbamoyltransferase, partial [Coprobacillus sp.]